MVKYHTCNPPRRIAGILRNRPGQSSAGGGFGGVECVVYQTIHQTSSTTTAAVGRQPHHGTRRKSIRTPR